MSESAVDRIVKAVLYEGYILYPYRPSAAKNRQRFTFGRVYPQAYSEAQKGAEPWVMQTEVLVHRTSDAVPKLKLKVQFLHPTARTVGQFSEPIAVLPEHPDFERVRALRIGERMYQTWQEAVEQTVDLPPLDLAEEPEVAFPFSFPAFCALEPILDVDEMIVGVFERQRQALEGAVRVVVGIVDEQTFRLTVRIENQTPMPSVMPEDDEAVVMRTLASAHTILTVENGAFLSLLEPPDAYSDAASACENLCTWPVLVGENAETDTMLSSPIILYDYPELAPESPGDFFDGLEMDEMLTLRILTMTDDEKNEMSQADEVGRRLLQRTEAMSAEQMKNLHGTIREMRPARASAAPAGGDGDTEPWDFFGEKTPLERVKVEGTTYETGGRVRIQPKSKADIMDMALEGRTAEIEAIEQDFEGKIHLALILDDDPGADLGRMRQPGHRFFFSPEDVEVLG